MPREQSYATEADSKPCGFGIRMGRVVYHES